MLQDPLYRQIRRRLCELTDGAGFELCANDLLRKVYSSLAPREGGDDAGLEGKATYQDRKSIQLICTTSREFSDIVANLKGSIESNIRKGGNSHACIFAIPKRLTNSQKRTLETKANELKRPLIEIYDQAWFAEALYRDARWTKELLGLTGNPPPLSLFPISNRPLFDTSPIGRDADLERLANAARHTMLVRQAASRNRQLLI